MNRKHLIIFILLLLSSATSCERLIIDNLPVNDSHQNVKTKATLIENTLPYTVSVRDVENYLVFYKKASVSSILDITAYDIEEDTRVYIANTTDKHWYLFSSDESAPAILAEGDNENLYLDGNLDNETKNWLKSIRSFLLNDADGLYGKQEYNRMMWLHVRRSASLESRQNIRMDDDTTDRIYDYIIDTLFSYDYPALTITKWNQGAPWNNNMPKMISVDTRCLAGCTVVALAQLFYYTHYAFGYPDSTYESAVCSVRCNQGPPYNFGLSNYSTNSWDLMVTESNSYNFYNPYAPSLIAHIASISNTEYGVLYPGATLMDDSYGETKQDSIPTTMSHFSLSGAGRHEYDVDSIINELVNGRPVLCAGTLTDTSSIGHAYLIDGYKWNRVKETEIVSDVYGNILEQNICYYELFHWHINSGNIRPHDFWIDKDAYYASNRKIYIGWE